MATRRRILVLIKGLGIGGAEKLISEGSRFWNREDFEYSAAYALPWKDQLVSELESNGIEVALVGGTRGVDLQLPGRLRSLIRDRGIDLLHAHLPSMGIAARLFSTVPVVYTEHNVTTSYRSSTRFLSRLTYSRNRAVIAVSEAVAQSVARWPGPTPLVIPNGVSVVAHADRTQAVRSELDVEEGTSLIVHVGNIRPGKGHDMLIDAVAVLARRRSDFLVASLGTEKNPGDLERVRQRAASEGVADRIRFMGRRNDAIDFIGAADVFVNPSEVEGLPIAVLEAMALSRPVVATAVGGVPTIVRSRETGLLVDPGDPDQLAKSIEELLEDRDTAASLGAAAHRIVESDYSLEAMIRSTEQVYRQVLDG